MKQSSVIAFALILAFVVFVTLRGELATYLGIFGLGGGSNSLSNGLGSGSNSGNNLNSLSNGLGSGNSMGAQENNQQATGGGFNLSSLFGGSYGGTDGAAQAIGGDFNLSDAFSSFGG